MKLDSKDPMRKTYIPVNNYFVQQLSHDFIQTIQGFSKNTMTHFFYIDVNKFGEIQIYEIYLQIQNHKHVYF